MTKFGSYLTGTFAEKYSDYGITLEPTKTEVLMYGSQNDYEILGTMIEIKDNATWLGVQNAITDTCEITYSLKQDKVFTLTNSCSIIKQYVPNLLDRLYVYDIYMKPCLDLILFAADEKTEMFLEDLEMKLIKSLLDLPYTVANKEVREISGVLPIKNRMRNFAISVSQTGILRLADISDVQANPTRAGPSHFEKGRITSIAERLKLMMSTWLPEPESKRPGTAKKLREWCKIRRRAVRSRANKTTNKNKNTTINNEDETKSTVSTNSLNAFHSDEEGESLDLPRYKLAP